MSAGDSSDELLDQFKLFLPVFAPRDEPFVTELRALEVPGWKPDVKPAEECGFFDLGSKAGRQALYEAIKGYTGRPPGGQPGGIYLMINPVVPELLGRANNRMGKKGKKISATDKDVLGRRWLVVDVDPVRKVAGISASDDEKAAAREVADRVREDLRGRGFAAPMLCDSGNGFHLWYRIDLPADDGGLVKDLLLGLARRHDTDRAKVDTSVYNPSRIMKIPGTWARKGDELPDRPHRLCRVLETPAEAQHDVQGHAA